MFSLILLLETNVENEYKSLSLANVTLLSGKELAAGVNFPKSRVAPDTVVNASLNSDSSDNSRASFHSEAKYKLVAIYVLKYNLFTE